MVKLDRSVFKRERERERIVYLKLVFSSKVILMPESIACFNNDDPLFISMIKYQCNLYKIPKIPVYLKWEILRMSIFYSHHQESIGNVTRHAI